MQIKVPWPPRQQRSRRDLVVDVLFAVIGLGPYLVLLTLDLTGVEPCDCGWPKKVLDTAVAIGLTALIWRGRRPWPVLIALVTFVAVVFTRGEDQFAFLMLFTVAVHRQFTVALPMAAALVACLTGSYAWRADDANLTEDLRSFGIEVGLVFLWAVIVRARREHVRLVRTEAEQVLTEQQLRAAQARTAERTRIAHEMHDVLAHRITQVSLHAGALEVDDAASPDDVAKAAGVIRAGAHQALEDLRGVIGVLRAGGEDRG